MVVPVEARCCRRQRLRLFFGDLVGQALQGTRAGAHFVVSIAPTASGLLGCSATARGLLGCYCVQMVVGVEGLPRSAPMYVSRQDVKLATACCLRRPLGCVALCLSSMAGLNKRPQTAG